MIKTIYLDMDGVLANFDGRYRELFGQAPPEKSVKSEETSHHWDEFVQGKNYRTLDWNPGGEKLWRFIKYSVDHERITVKILSSTGGGKYHEEVAKQKQRWLADHGIHFRAIFVESKKLKAQYANPESILVDDRKEVITPFNKAGGHGILHTNTEETIKQLKSLIRSH
jgi:phosphoglycolate phosphatase-like HAD superfamily hydrolase